MVENEGGGETWRGSCHAGEGSPTGRPVRLKLSFRLYVSLFFLFHFASSSGFKWIINYLRALKF